MVALVSALVLAAPLPAQEVMNNQTVIALTRAGLGEQVIIAKIRASTVQFDMSTDQMIELKRKGVSDNVISAMVEAAGRAPTAETLVNDSPDPKVPHSAGIYMLDDSAGPAKMVRLDPVRTNQTKTGGFLGSALTGGIAKIKITTVLPGLAARIHTLSAHPKFYFFFNQPGAANPGQYVPGQYPQYDPQQFMGGIGGMGSFAKSPNEFSLVRFDVKKDHREASIGSFNVAGGAMGVQDKQRMQLTYNDVRPGVFEVTPAGDLPPGEYAFVSSGPAGMTMMSSIYDFSVAPSGTPAAASR